MSQTNRGALEVRVMHRFARTTMLDWLGKAGKAESMSVEVLDKENFGENFGGKVFW